MCPEKSNDTNNAPLPENDDVLQSGVMLSHSPDTGKIAIQVPLIELEQFAKRTENPQTESDWNEVFKNPYSPILQIIEEMIFEEIAEEEFITELLYRIEAYRLKVETSEDEELAIKEIEQALKTQSLINQFTQQYAQQKAKTILAKFSKENESGDPALISTMAENLKKELAIHETIKDVIDKQLKTIQNEKSTLNNDCLVYQQELANLFDSSSTSEPVKQNRQAIKDVMAELSITSEEEEAEIDTHLNAMKDALAPSNDQEEASLCRLARYVTENQQPAATFDELTAAANASADAVAKLVVKAEQSLQNTAIPLQATVQDLSQTTQNEIERKRIDDEALLKAAKASADAIANLFNASNDSLAPPKTEPHISQHSLFTHAPETKPTADMVPTVINVPAAEEGKKTAIALCSPLAHLKRAADEIKAYCSLSRSLGYDGDDKFNPSKAKACAKAGFCLATPEMEARREKLAAKALNLCRQEAVLKQSATVCDANIKAKTKALGELETLEEGKKNQQSPHR